MRRMRMIGGSVDLRGLPVAKDEDGRAMGAEAGDLFEPSVGQTRPYNPSPWNPASHVYVAFFGGVIALTAIAYLNASRLHLEEKAALRFILWGLGAFAAAIAVAYAIEGAVADSDQARSYVRLGSRAVAIGLHFIFAARLKQSDRRFQFADGEYESLWGPGIAAVIVGGIVQGVFLTAMVGVG